MLRLETITGCLVHRRTEALDQGLSVRHSAVLQSSFHSLYSILSDQINGSLYYMGDEKRIPRKQDALQGSAEERHLLAGKVRLLTVRFFCKQ
jgi:hypothetical protein